jgi:hypothetical protein
VKLHFGKVQQHFIGNHDVFSSGLSLYGMASLPQMEVVYLISSLGMGVRYGR